MFKESLLTLEKNVIQNFRNCSTEKGTTRQPMELFETFRSSGFVPDNKEDEQALFALGLVFKTSHFDPKMCDFGKKMFFGETLKPLKSK